MTVYIIMQEWIQGEGGGSWGQDSLGEFQNAFKKENSHGHEQMRQYTQLLEYPECFTWCDLVL